ncbi:MAG: histidine--tRNA ligase [Acidiferrobacter sp.]
MSRQVPGVRGISALSPGDAANWTRIEDCARSLFAAYGYQEIRLPLLEHTELYERAVGAVTDIVEKEMYTFVDRNGESLSLRPEGTAGCVRAGIEAGLFHNQIQRLWYQGPMFRHERPQKGRYRQFHQLGIEAYGMAGPDIEAEIILLGERLWRRLGVTTRLLVNSLGTDACRDAYRAALVAYLEAHTEALDDDSRRRLGRNPLRILDSKNPAMEALLAAAPRLGDYWNPAARAHFDGLLDRLSRAGVAYEVTPRLVRGLDYYSHSVFEWVSADLGAQATIAAGGRYDGLVEALGGAMTPAVGFAVGLERLVSLVARPQTTVPPDVFFVTTANTADRALLLAEGLRDAGLTVEVHLGGASAKSQGRRATQSGARLTLYADAEHIGVARGGVHEGTLPWGEGAAAAVAKRLAI